MRIGRRTYRRNKVLARHWRKNEPAAYATHLVSSVFLFLLTAIFSLFILIFVNTAVITACMHYLYPHLGSYAEILTLLWIGFTMVLALLVAPVLMLRLSHDSVLYYHLSKLWCNPNKDHVLPCPGCGYNLHNCESDTCPECGTPKPTCIEDYKR